jgi:cob(I)alamin adenosyltransferase
MKKEEKGYVQVYTGDGKGKTTASLGVCLRALAHGMKVFYAQFIKDGSSGEFEALKHFESFTHKAYGRGRFIKGSPADEDIEIAKQGLKECAEAVSSGDYGLVVLDEAIPALSSGLFDLEDALKILSNKHPKTEIILTGRYAPPELLKAADLVTEMKEIKHYWKKGVPARKGIEK